MNRFDEHDEKGTGDGFFSDFSRVKIKSEGKEEGELIRAYSETGVSPVPRPLADELSRYLAANPGMTARDFKGKGFTAFAPFDKHHVAPNEKLWDALDPAEVRQAATGRPARFLSKSERQAAARDPALIWDEGSRSYRKRLASDPSPFSLPTEDDGEGAMKVTAPSRTRPAASLPTPAIPKPRARARRHHGETS
jgi:hypothetical protein